MISVIGKLAERMAIHGFRAVCGFRFWGVSLAGAAMILSAAMVMAEPPPTAGPSKPAPAPEPSPIKFVQHRIGTFRGEAFGVADFNGDGKLDIVAGEFLYLAPDYKPLKIRSIKGKVDERGKGYINDFMNGPVDLEGKGRPGVVSVDWFSRSVYYYRNTLGETGDWPETKVDTADNYECGDLVDLEGKGKANAILTHTRETVWFEVGVKDGKPGLVKHVVSAKKMEFGAGAGDVNGDGRPDIIRPNAWFEAPADIRNGQWKEHPLSLGANGNRVAHTPQILVYDVNGDGLNDFITSNAHGYGIFWYEQARDGEKVSWKQHTIDETWTQAHSLVLADLDGCGVPELITGKRFMAHNGGDPDEYGKLGVYYYKLIRKPDKTAEWRKYAISYDEGIGAGLAIWAGDFRGAGAIDIIVTGKFGGPVWFENKGK
jgi:hypothetical protein